MITIQEYEQAENKEKFIVEAMDEHFVNTATMLEDEQYYHGNNPFLARFANTLTLKGEDGTSVPIDLTPTIKIPSSFFGIIVGHIVGRLWDNPVQIFGKTLNEKEDDVYCDEVFGENFYGVVHQMATYSAIHGVCYAFYNMGNVEMFKATEYVPFCDERTGAHMAGLRFWRAAEKKPWVVQFYDMEGYTEWRREHGESTLQFVAKLPYKQNVPVGGEVYVNTTPITAGEPYADYPIVPLYTNPARVSEMSAPIKAKINAYDAKETGYMDEALKMKFIMWVFKGYGGDPIKLKSMLKTLQELGIIAGGDVDDTQIEAKPADIPYLSHESTLDRIEAAIYRDARIMNPTVLMNGGVTTVAIRAAMQREDKKMVGIESEARQFIRRLLNVAGIDYEYISFTHKTLINEMEVVQMLSTGLGDLPFEWRVKLSPAVPQELTDEIIATYEANTVGLTDESLAQLEEIAKGIIDEQIDKRQSAIAGQKTGDSV